MISAKDLEIVNEYYRDLIDDPRIKVYISGPVSMHNDDAKALDIFDKATMETQKELDQKYGENKYFVINPVRFNLIEYEGLKNMNWGDYMVGDLLILSACQYIRLLPDWELSSGATMERDFAIRNGIKLLEDNGKQDS
jgi:hypothetical protein